MGISDEDIDAFLNELESLYYKHGLSLGHEDSHGAFIINLLRQEDINWVREAHRRALYKEE